MISDYPARGEGHHPPITNRCSTPPTISAAGLATLAATEFPRSDVIRPHVHGNQPRPPLIPLKQIARINLTGHIGQLVAPAVGDDHVALGLECLKIVRYLAAEELRRVQRGLVDHHGHALDLDALHDALHARCAEVVGARLYREALRAYHRRGRAGVHELGHFGEHLVGHEILARAVGLHDGPDQALRHILVVHQQPLGVLGQAVASVAEAGVVAMTADAGFKAHALDDLGSIKPARAGIGVQLVEVSHAQRQIRVAEELHRLGPSSAKCS